jgi:hypothetical protein
MSRTVGTIKYLFGPGVYQQPTHSTSTQTQDALKNFINKYGSATKRRQNGALSIEDTKHTLATSLQKKTATL